MSFSKILLKGKAVSKAATLSGWSVHAEVAFLDDPL
jgi:hypothetical protein